MEAVAGRLLDTVSVLQGHGGHADEGRRRARSSAALRGRREREEKELAKEGEGAGLSCGLRGAKSGKGGRLEGGRRRGGLVGSLPARHRAG